MLKKENTAMILFSRLLGSPTSIKLKEGFSKETRKVKANSNNSKKSKTNTFFR
ncbi:MAG: hypothetical protein Q7S55_00270 [Nanoarchaeota archaeon]|nr:hypothetical protein [Nanoarchaeota archaeon]